MKKWKGDWVLSISSSTVWSVVRDAVRLCLLDMTWYYTHRLTAAVVSKTVSQAYLVSFHYSPALAGFKLKATPSTPASSQVYLPRWLMNIKGQFFQPWVYWISSWRQPWLNMEQSLDLSVLSPWEFDKVKSLHLSLGLLYSVRWC